MARFGKPILFSQFYNFDPAKLDEAGLIDPFTNVDVQLFIDPILLPKSQNSIIRTKAFACFQNHFSNFVRLLAVSEMERDAAWRSAYRLLDLREPPENGLGYGGAGRSGASRPEDIRLCIMRTAREIITLGSKDPEMISLMGFFEEGVGPDTISDFTTRVIIDQLAEITYNFCVGAGIPTNPNEVSTDFELPTITNSNNERKFLVLVPKDIVRDLPIANDWGSLNQAISASQNIRDRVNRMLGGLATTTVTDRKNALKRVALSSEGNFDDFLQAVKQFARNYDENDDALAYYKLREILSNGFPDLKFETKLDFSSDTEAVFKVALETVNIFKHHVENGNLWEELWVEDKPKKERAAQLIYFAIADCFCRANNIDISPEANMGGGPVDFKFSSGYKSRVLVEMKRSGGAVKHGYEKQLEFYLNASQTDFGIFVVMDYGDLGQKLDQILEIQKSRRANKQRTSEIIIIDATQKKSASKRG
ncbi:hypothetical protein MCERH10_02346 [Caulobacteraceae bacterium]